MIHTIEGLEKENWGEPESAGWPLVEKCLKLRRKPIRQFSVEDLRLMIGQDIGTKFLMPYALDILELNPFARGHCYPGDLLAGVIRLRSEYWLNYEDQQRRTVAIAHKGLAMLREGEENSLFDRKLGRELQSFIWRHERMGTYTSLSLTVNQSDDYRN